MGIIRLFLMFFLSLASLLITSSISVSVIFILLFFIGRQTVGYFQAKEFKKDALLIFETSYMVFFIYALMCFTFMTLHNYDYLQSIDGISVYIPYTQELLDTSSLKNLIFEIYNSWKYSFAGSILIVFVYIGKLSSLMDGELYVTIQISILLFAAWTSVVVYNILVINKIPNKLALIYTLLYSFLSIHFLMSTFIVRDMPITLFFTLLIYLSFKPITIRIISIALLLVFLIMSIRLSSGIFASLYIFLILISSIKKGNSLKKLASFLILSIFVLVAFAYIDSIQSTYELKHAQYSALEAAAGKGTSTVAAFNILPPGISHLFKAFYNQLMPIPSWRTMIETSFRPESYNIMNFPVITATFFRYCMWFIIFIGLSSKKTRTFIMKNKVLVYNMLIAILFIAVQTDSMGHRRILGVYPVFFLLSVLIYQNLNSKNKKIMLVIPLAVFAVLQFVDLSNI